MAREVPGTLPTVANRQGPWASETRISRPMNATEPGRAPRGRQGAGGLRPQRRVAEAFVDLRLSRGGRRRPSWR